MPYISTEALVGAALLVVLAFSYQYIPKADPSSTESSKSKKKNKKKSKGAAAEAEQDQKSQASKSSGKNGKQGNASGAKVVEQAQLTPAAAVNGHSARTPQLGKEISNGPAPTGTFASIAGGSSSPVATKQKPKTLAEKIAPKNRKTKVDDMLAPEDLPATHARVMRVTKPSNNTPGPAIAPIPVPEPVEPVQAVNPLGSERVDKFSGDYASNSDEDEEPRQVVRGKGQSQKVEDDGWNVVASKPKKAVSLSMTAGSTGNTSQPLPVSTKIQRKNAKKAEQKKAARAAEEADRQVRLAAHRRDLERAKINEIYNQKSKTANTKSTASATVDERGKLIWD